MSATPRSGLRFLLRRQASVVRRSPFPFTSIEPPSSTMPLGKRRRPRSRAILEGIRLSLSKGGYFPPQELNSQSVTAISPVLSFRTKIGPWSRHHASFVGLP